jgi:hypothetical protein
MISIVAALLLLAVAAPASAHTCSSNTHEGCNGHQCPDGEAHDHQTHHDVGGNHFCKTTADCGSGAEQADGGPAGSPDNAPCTGGGSGNHEGLGVPLLGSVLLWKARPTRRNPGRPRRAANRGRARRIERAAGHVSLVALAAALLLMAQAPSAAAHTCSFNDHLVCNGHQCPDDLLGSITGHDHQTLHEGPEGNHWCQSGAHNPASQALGLGVFAAQLPALFPAWILLQLFS